MSEGGQFENMGKVLKHTFPTLAQSQTMGPNIPNIPNKEKLNIFSTFELHFLELWKKPQEMVKN